MMLCLQRFCSVFSNMEEQLSEDQAAVYSLLSDQDKYVFWHGCCLPVTLSHNSRIHTHTQFLWYNCTKTAHYINKSKQLMVEVNNIHHFAAGLYSTAKPWILPFMWLPLDTKHPARHPCRQSTLVLSRTFCSATPQKASLYSDCSRYIRIASYEQ